MTHWILAAAAIVLLLVNGYFSYQYLTHRNPTLEEKTLFFSWKFSAKPACVVGVAVVLSIVAFFFCWYQRQDSFMRAFMNAQVLIYLAVLGYIDWQERIIPNPLIVAGISFWVVLTLIDVFAAKTAWVPLLKKSLLGGLLVGGAMFLIALIVKSALGMGDVKLFFGLGLLYGVVDTYSILLFSMMIMAAVSLALLAIKKVSVKTAIPMAPFVVIGFILCIIAGM